MEGLQNPVVSPIMLLKLGRSSWFWLSIEKVNRSYLTLQVSSDFFNNIFKQDYNIILIITTKPCFYCRSRYCQEKKYIDSSGFVDFQNKHFEFDSEQFADNFNINVSLLSKCI